VKSITEIPKESIIVKVFLLFAFLSFTELPKITGSTGNTHGASMVNIPAINDTMSNNILCFNYFT
jgi:hypothetical protein